MRLTLFKATPMSQAPGIAMAAAGTVLVVSTDGLPVPIAVGLCLISLGTWLVCGRKSASFDDTHFAVEYALLDRVVWARRFWRTEMGPDVEAVVRGRGRLSHCAHIEIKGRGSIELFRSRSEDEARRFCDEANLLLKSCPPAGAGYAEPANGS